MLGVFAKVVRGETVKSRLQPALSRQEAEGFHVSSLADTLETALRIVPAPTLFLQGEAAAGLTDLRARLIDCGLDAARWEAVRVRWQCEGDLGVRLESAFEALAAEPGTPGPALVLGSDSPSLPPAYIRAGMGLLGLPTLALPAGAIDAGEKESAHPPDRPHTRNAGQEPDSAAANRPEVPSGAATSRPAVRSSGNEAHIDCVLGPTLDGGYWAIGLRRPQRGLLRNVAWSTARTLEDTLARTSAFGLRTELLPLWTDVDRPEDLPELSRQIARLRQGGDTRTARHTERFLSALGARHA